MSEGGGSFDWKIYAELHAAMTSALRETERRICDRIDAAQGQVTALEQRLRDAEASLVQVKTVGLLVMAGSTLVSLAIAIAGFIVQVRAG